MKWIQRLLILCIGLALLAGVLLLIPSIRERIFYHIDTAYIQVKYALFPPEQEVFTPNQQAGVAMRASQTAAAVVPPTATPTPTVTATLPPDQPSPTPSPTSTPLPGQVEIQGVKYIDQHGLYNYCAPANLAMALSYWGWTGDRTDVGKVVKPFEKDKNVMPYELADYVTQNTAFKVVERLGGTLELVKTLLAGGFPVMVEKGAYLDDLTNKISWMGHYAVITGYDDATQMLTTQDSFFSANYPVSYADFMQGWRAFNYVFLVVYAPEKEANLMSLLGPYADETAAAKIALEKSAQEVNTTSGNDQFFAWYNRGTSLVFLNDFVNASGAFDQAFQLYAGLTVDRRPWRMIWYQTGPYFAYYYSGRYEDVKKLASQTIDAASEPYIEESWYWRALAREALGDQEGAISDLRQSLVYHPDFAPSLAEMKSLGVSP
jgi:uncharacterized protein YvpB